MTRPDCWKRLLPSGTFVCWVLATDCFMRMPPSVIKPSLACTTLASLALVMGACGPTGDGPRAGRRTATAANATGATGIAANAATGAGTLERDPTDRDYDRPGSREDPDNDRTPAFGRAASPADARAIGALIRHYYALAASGDGAGACRLVSALLIESLAETGGRGRRVPAATICARTASAQFRRAHREIVEDLTGVDFMQVRVRERRGLALVLFAGVRERLIPVRREGGAWRMSTLLDGGSP